MATAQHADPLHDLTGFQRDILAIVAGKTKPCGLDIKTDLENSGYSEVHHGRLYPNLDDLVDVGLLNKRDGDDRRSNAYSLTARGRRELDSHRKWTDAAMEGDLNE